MTETALQERIAKVLDELKVKPDALAEIAGVSRPAVVQWKNGQTKSILPEAAYKIEDAKGISARWLITGEGSMRPSPQTSHDISESDAPPYENLYPALISALDALPTEHKEAVALQLLNAILVLTASSNPADARAMASLISDKMDKKNRKNA